MLRQILPVAALAVITTTSKARADVVIDWNITLNDIVRLTGGPPTPIARAYGMTHAAIYDSVNSILQTHQPYKFQLPAPAGASPDAAAVAAAHTVLTHLYPAQSALLDTRYNTSLAGLPDAGKADGIALGQTIAAKVIQKHQTDGFDQTINYIPGNNPGDWRPTAPGFADAFTPHWGNCVPWAMTSTTQFRPPLPPALDSAEYAAALNEVKTIGSKSATPAERSARDTETAWFWANDRNGTYKPPGHLNYITQVIAANQNNTMPENARLFALVNIALGDAGIVAWDAKYNTPVDLWRPVTGIQEAGDGTPGDADGNSATTADPNWEPLNNLPTPGAILEGAGAVGTPPFPAYISGHATFGATHSAVLREFYGTDNLTFTITSDDTPGVFRTYDSLEAIARENGRSRVFLGVHWQFDADYGYTSGDALGEYVATSFLQPIPEPAGLTLALSSLFICRRKRK